MDAYFASVELQRRPELRGLPVVIGGRPKPGLLSEPGRLSSYAGRGVVTTATYEARAFGVHSGMGLMKAAALAPDAILVPGDYETYSRVSRTFKAAVATIAPLMEDRGIDEIYLDLTDLKGSSLELARRLKGAVLESTGLTCSIGITPNKLLSKLASELQKPDGITILNLEDIPGRIWPLPCAALNGIGPRATEGLRELGILTLGQLAQADPADLVARFGQSYGTWLHEAAHGRDERPLTLEREPKSLSRETTFERNLHPSRNREELTAILVRLCERLAADLTRKGYLAGSVGVKLKYDDFSTLTRDHTLSRPVSAPEALLEAARRCLRRAPFERPLRLLGLRAAALVRPGDLPTGPKVVAPGLFDTPPSGGHF